jgi:hypothetical protein
MLRQCWHSCIPSCIHCRRPSATASGNDEPLVPQRSDTATPPAEIDLCVSSGEGPDEQVAALILEALKELVKTTPPPRECVCRQFEHWSWLSDEECTALPEALGVVPESIARHFNAVISAQRDTLSDSTIRVYGVTSIGVSIFTLEAMKTIRDSPTLPRKVSRDSRERINPRGLRLRFNLACEAPAP